MMLKTLTDHHDYWAWQAVAAPVLKPECELHIAYAQRETQCQKQNNYEESKDLIV